MSLALDWLRREDKEDPMRYLDDVFRYARTRLGDREEAEDVAIEVVQSLPNPCRRGELRSYMVGMARRKIADRLRRRRPFAALREGDAVGRFDFASDEAASVEAALARLTAEHRELLTLKYLLGFSSREIGLALGKRADAVDSGLQRARAAFAEIWKEME